MTNTHKMDKPRIQVDFNELVENDLVCLSKSDEIKDSEGKTHVLSEGLKVSIYEYNSYDNGEDEYLLADGVVILNNTVANGDWTKAAKWCCRIDDNGVSHKVFDIPKLEQASKQVQVMLYGCQLDQLHVFSTVLNIGFFRPSSEIESLTTVWLSICGDAFLSNEESISMTDLSEDTFFDRRANLISELYQLMGHSITHAKIGGFGRLEVYLGNKVLTCFIGKGDQVLEDNVWAITSNDPTPYKAHEWSVLLDANGEIVLESPLT